MNNKKVCKQILMGLAISLLLPILVGCKDQENNKEDSQEQLSDANKIEITERIKKNNNCLSFWIFTK